MPAFAFKFISGKYQGVEFPVPDQGEILIGRASDLDLVLVEDMVSRKHAKVMVAPAGLTITDLGSTNGTFVNGEKIRRADLKKNDRILIGTSILKVIHASDMTVDRLDAQSARSIREIMEQAASRAPQASAMSGDLEEVPLPDLLQLFATNKKSGVLDIAGEKRGKIYIKNGQIQTAVVTELPDLPAPKALGRMINWAKGAFRLEPYDDTELVKVAFKESTESVLIETLRQADEIKRLLPELPPPDARMAMCIPMVPQLSELSKSALDTLQLVLNFNRLQTVLDKSPTSDHETVHNLHKLLKEGYLEIE